MNEIFRMENLQYSGRVPLRTSDFYFMQSEIVSIILRSSTLRNTLMSLFSGVLPPTGALVYLDEKQINPAEWERRLRQDIYCIWRIGGLINNLTVTDNLFINRRSDFLIKSKSASVKASILLQKYNLDGISPDVKAESLTYAEQHMVELLKAVANRAKMVLIEDMLDRYSTAEAKRFTKLIEQMRAEGMTICFFTNTYSDIVAISNRVMVIKEGVVTANFYGESVKYRRNIIAALAGTTEANDLINEPTQKRSQPMTDSMVGISLYGDFGFHKKRKIALTVQKGSLCGLIDFSSDAGFHLANVLSGKEHFQGEMRLDSELYRPVDELAAAKAGVYIINTNANYSFAMLNMNLVDNVTLMMPSSITFHGFETKNMKKYLASHVLHMLGCEYLLDKYPENKPIGIANRRAQIEIAIARLVCAKAKVIVLINPMSYYDDFNLLELRKILLHACELKTTILVVSSNIEQLASLCDIVQPL